MFCRVFDHTPTGREVGDRVMSLSQGNQRVVEFALEFRTLAAETGRNKPALKATFHQGFNCNILAKLAYRDGEVTLDSLIDKAIRIKNLLQDRHQTLAGLPVSTLTPIDPMQLGNTQLSSSECTR